MRTLFGIAFTLLGIVAMGYALVRMKVVRSSELGFRFLHSGARTATHDEMVLLALGLVLTCSVIYLASQMAKKR